MQIIYFADDELGPRKAECIPQGHVDESKKGLRPEGSFWFLPGALSTHFPFKSPNSVHTDYSKNPSV